MRMFNKLTCRLLACLLFFNCLPALLSAQGTQAIITGTVMDNKGESVIGATIQVKNESTGFFTGSITNDKGEYTIKQLPVKVLVPDFVTALTVPPPERPLVTSY